ncbi:DUF4231 domain-containing protein [Streptomyces sp. NPDC126933]|uniref:DUF4231 domain-containing protein n=1 Tax=unclassified Streptomyces TaxID=2593676 RepID=UPI00364D3686
MARTTEVEDRAIEQLLRHDRTILDLRQEIRRARLARFTVIAIWSSTPLLVLFLLVGNIATWRRFDFARINLACIPITVALLIASFIVFIRIVDTAHAHWEADYISTKRLDLEIEIERKRLHAANTALSTGTHRHVYRETIPVAIEQYRSESKYYRRVHNTFQSVIIVGSLGASTLAGLAETPPPYKWLVVGVSFTVGVAAGFTGYFKFRERSFHLQQTADAIEEEMDTFILKVGRYRNQPNNDTAMVDFTERVESLKSDQRKRQQQLDQPTETPPA